MNKHIPKALVPEVVTHQVFLTCAHSHDGNLRELLDSFYVTLWQLCVLQHSKLYSMTVLYLVVVAVVSAAGSYQQGPRSQAYHIFCSLVWIDNNYYTDVEEQRKTGRSSASVYYCQRKPKNSKWGRPGNEARGSICFSQTPNL